MVSRCMSEAQLCNLSAIINQHLGWFQAFATAVPRAVNTLTDVPLDTCWNIVVSFFFLIANFNTLLSLSKGGTMPRARASETSVFNFLNYESLGSLVKIAVSDSGALGCVQESPFKASSNTASPSTTPTSKTLEGTH